MKQSLAFTATAMSAGLAARADAPVMQRAYASTRPVIGAAGARLTEQAADSNFARARLGLSGQGLPGFRAHSRIWPDIARIG